MPKYQVLLEGRDFPARLSDDGKCLGFFTTRFVEADDAEAAECLAVNLVRDELWDFVGPAQEGDSTPMMSLDEISVIDDLPDDGPGRGFTWFPMDEEE